MPQIRLVNCLWTASSLCMSPVWCGNHSWLQYSRCGWIRDFQNVNMTSGFLEMKVLSTTQPSPWLSSPWRWCGAWRFRPHSGAAPGTWREAWERCHGHVLSSGRWSLWWLFGPHIISNFCSLKSILFSLAQANTVLRSCWRCWTSLASLTALLMVVSSAKDERKELCTVLPMSPKCTRKRSGPSTDPCLVVLRWSQLFVPSTVLPWSPAESFL